MPKHIRRVNLGIDQYEETAVQSILGARLLMIESKTAPQWAGRVGGDGCKLNQYLSTLLGEALYAAEEFVDQHGYLPWQPRFRVEMEDSTPRGPRRDEKIDEVDAINAVLANAEVRRA